jgi:hypothetical protein
LRKNSREEQQKEEILRLNEVLQNEEEEPKPSEETESAEVGLLTQTKETPKKEEPAPQKPKASAPTLYIKPVGGAVVREFQRGGAVFSPDAQRLADA